MKGILISGVPCHTYGPDRNTGAEMLSFSPQDISAEEIANLTDVYLHPTCPPTETEIFAFRAKGSDAKAYKRASIRTHCALLAARESGSTPTSTVEKEFWESMVRARANVLETSFTPWYDERAEEREPEMEYPQ